jgi:hypothetical protein
VNRLECLAMAIAHENDCFNPGSEAFATLNPGMLRGPSLERLHVFNESGTRVYGSFHAGWRALVGNLEAKCTGKTQAKGENGKLKPDSTLADLVRTFRFVQTRKVIEYLNDGLEDKGINELTPLSYFLVK